MWLKPRLSETRVRLQLCSVDRAWPRSCAPWSSMLLFLRDKCAILGSGRGNEGHWKHGVLSMHWNLRELGGMRRPLSLRLVAQEFRVPGAAHQGTRAQRKGMGKGVSPAVLCHELVI